MRRIANAFWGNLTRAELTKFILLSCSLFFLIGSYWPLRTLKESIFINMVGSSHLPEAKFLSLFLFFPLVLIYSRLIDIFSKEKIIYVLVTFYSVTGFMFVYFLSDPNYGLANEIQSSGRIIAWAFYVFAESYISLMNALIWSFINDVTTPESAKKGYGLIIFGAQLGGAIFTGIGTALSRNEALYATRAPLIVAISIVLISGIGFSVWLLKKIVPQEELEGFKDPAQAEAETVGFFDGLKVLIQQPYVAGIFAIIFAQEVLATMMNYQMERLVELQILSHGARNAFLFDFAMAIQVIACVFSLTGTSFFQRTFGIRKCLFWFPFLFGLGVIGFMFWPTLYYVTGFMILFKALNYALNQAVKEVLYIPTSKSIKYKAKAWIDMFGARFSKATGSFANKIFGNFPILTGGLALGLVGGWLLTARIMGKSYHRKVNGQTTIE